MREKGRTLDKKGLLAKNPKAAKVLEENRKKMGQNRRLRPRKEYGSAFHTIGRRSHPWMIAKERRTQYE